MAKSIETGKKAEAFEVTLLTLGSILVSDGWNSRSGHYDNADEKAGDPETGRGFGALVASIKENGVEDPVEVRPNPEKSTSKKHPYVLVAGYRRVKAAKLAGLTEIPAIVKQMSEAQARLRNIRENTDREDLKGADLAWGVNEICKLEPSRADGSIARDLGLSQSYVNKLRRIMQELPPKMTSAWRNGTVDITVSEMYTLLAVAKKTPEKLDDSFKTLVSRREPPSAEDGSDGGETADTKKTQWLESLMARAFSLGRDIGVLTKIGIVDPSNIPHDPEKLEKAITFVLGNKRKLTPSEARKVTKKIEVGMLQGHEENLESEDDEESIAKMKAAPKSVAAN